MNKKEKKKKKDNHFFSYRLEEVELKEFTK